MVRRACLAAAAAAAVLLAQNPPAAAQEAVVEMFGPPRNTALCKKCTCVDCPCVTEIPECVKCDPRSLVVRIHIDNVDGECHATRMEAANPFVDMSLLAPMRFMAAVSKGGVWLSADGATKNECEVKASGLIREFEAGEYDAHTDACFPGSPGSYLRLSFNDPDDYLLRHVPERHAFAYLASPSTISYMILQASDLIPVVVPPLLLGLYFCRNRLPRARQGGVMRVMLAVPIFAGALMLLAATAGPRG